VFLLVAWISFSLSDSDGSGIVAATANEASYLLSGFDITYPASSHGLGEDLDESYAAVSFDATWSEDTFPGTSQCELMLFNGDGAIVGRSTFSFSSLEQSARLKLHPVPVAERPASVEGGCSEAEPPSQIGYGFTDLAVVDNENTRHGDLLVGTVTTEGGVLPGAHLCTAHLEYADRIEPFLFTLDAGDGNPLSLVLPQELQGARGATVDCEPYSVPVSASGE
jgi:hypothetical protein